MDTVTRPVRWRIRDLAKCFSTSCTFGIDDGSSGNLHRSRYSNTTYQSSIGKAQMDRHRNDRRNKGICSGHRERTKRVSDTGQLEEAKSRSNKPVVNFSEEDYIVFCISKDGAIDLSNDRTNEVSRVHDTTFPNIQKVSSYGSRTARVRDCCLSHDSHISNKPDSCVEEAVQKEAKVHDFSPPKQSRSSNSSSSFSFPELMCEWIGSPAQMPKPDDHQNGLRMLRAIGPFPVDVPCRFCCQ